METKDLVDRVAAECVAVRVRVLNRVVTNLYDEALRPHGIRINQMNLMVVVAKLGRARPVEVGRILKLEKSTLSRDVEILKRAGWIESDPPDGGRNQRISITDSGVERLRAALPAWEAAQREVHALLGDESALSLRALADNLTRPRPD